MNEAANHTKLVTCYPTPMRLPEYNAPTFACISPRKIEETTQTPKEQNEVLRLRCELLKLAEELERARLQPLLDTSFDRINVHHDIWLKQQRDLRSLQQYRTRYYVLALVLLLLVARFCLHSIAHI